MANLLSQGPLMHPHWFVRQYAAVSDFRAYPAGIAGGPCSTGGVTWSLMAQKTDLTPRNSALSCHARGAARKKRGFSAVQKGR